MTRSLEGRTETTDAESKQGIPDLTLAVLLDIISQIKGDNIVSGVHQPLFMDVKLTSSPS